MCDIFIDNQLVIKIGLKKESEILVFRNKLDYVCSPLGNRGFFSFKNLIF